MGRVRYFLFVALFIGSTNSLLIAEAINETDYTVVSVEATEGVELPPWVVNVSPTATFFGKCIAIYEAGYTPRFLENVSETWDAMSMGFPFHKSENEIQYTQYSDGYLFEMLVDKNNTIISASIAPYRQDE